MKLKVYAVDGLWAGSMEFKVKLEVKYSTEAVGWDGRHI